MADLAIDPQAELNPPLVLGNPSYHEVTEQISEITEWQTPKAWYVMTAITGLITLNLVGMLTYLVARGIGVWGNNSPVGWAWDITNFVFWIGIGHAGTLISAILFLFRQKWRTSINRSAEAMTIFAVACAAIFPLFHIGRPWRASTGCSRSRTRTSHLAELPSARSSGTCSRSPPTARSRCSSGTSG